MNLLQKLNYAVKEAYYEYRCEKAYNEVQKHLGNDSHIERAHWQQEYIKYSKLRLEVTAKKLLSKTEL